MSERFDVLHKWLGIPPEEQPPNHYRLLGVSLFETDPDVIAHAADQRMAHLRSFQTGPHAELSQKLLNAVAMAKVCLLSPEAKDRYDRVLLQEVAPRGSRPTALLGTQASRAMPLRASSRAKDHPAWFWPLTTAVVVVIALGALGGFLFLSRANRREVAQDSVAPVAQAVTAVSAPSLADTNDSHGAAQQDEGIENAVQRKDAAAESSLDPAEMPPATPEARPAAPSAPASPAAEVRPAPSVPTESPQPKEMDLTAVVEKVRPSVVQVNTVRGIGSGFVVDAKGLIVTNYHVIEDVIAAEVVFPSQLSAKVEGYVAVDSKRDLALLQVRVKEPLTPIPLSSGLPRSGEKVAAFGAPIGFSDTVTDGIVSSIRRGKEIEEVIGKGAYQSWLGYDSNATWIQTTAPISGGNSGGPLVDMQGRVVGMNTWTRRDAQNLNFAIAATEIVTLLKKAGKQVRPLASLPRSKPPIIAGAPGMGSPPPMSGARSGVERRPGKPTFATVSLLSGAKLTDSMLDLPVAWQDKLFPDRTPVYVARYPNDKIRGVYQHQEGKLHGWVARLYPNGRLYCLACYHVAQLDGILRVWEEETGRMLVYGEYVNDRKHGLVCLFQEDLPRLVQEWDKDKLQREYLVRFESPEPLATPKEQLDPDDIKELLEAGRILAREEKKVSENEQDVKRELTAEYRKAVAEERQKLAAGLSVQKRAAMSARARARNAARAAEATENAEQWRRPLRSAYGR